jgi:urease gamma subunit
VFAVAELARRTLRRGLRLNAPEAIALICDEMHMTARAGGSFDDVVDAGRRALRPDQVLDGVPSLASEIRLEVLLDEGTRLVVLRDALGAKDDAPGAIQTADGDVELARKVVRGSVMDGTVVFHVEAIPKTAGPHLVVGVFRFSVNNGERLDIKAAPFESTVTATD